MHLAYIVMVPSLSFSTELMELVCAMENHSPLDQSYQHLTGLMTPSLALRNLTQRIVTLLRAVKTL